jgi:hypothetical protein
MADISEEVTLKTPGPINPMTTKVKLTFKDCKITIEKDLRFIKSPASATDAAFNAFKQNFKNAIDKFFNGKFRLRMKAGGKCPDCTTIPIEIKINEVATGGYAVTLKIGSSDSSPSATDGSTIQENDRTGSPAAANECTYAHESGHLILGADDEYKDNSSGNPVHTDNSLMGNYHNEGYDKAELKDRHFEFLKTWLQGKLAGCEVTLEKAS